MSGLHVYPTRLFLGLDLGLRADHSTLALIEPALHTTGQRPGAAMDSTLLIPRDHLLSCLRILFEAGTLLITPDLPVARQFEDELSALRHTPALRRQS